MPQIKKDDVKNAIDAAAKKIFESKGYSNTKMEDIAREAGISVGNLYRYEKSKDGLFSRLYPQSLADDFLVRIREKLAMFFKAGGKINREDPVLLEFNRFTLESSKTLIVLAKNNKGSFYEGFTERLAGKLVEEICKYLPDGSKNSSANNIQKDILRILYTGLIKLYINILESADDEDIKLNKLAAINIYHVSGILTLLNLNSEE